MVGIPFFTFGIPCNSKVVEILRPPDCTLICRESMVKPALSVWVRCAPDQVRWLIALSVQVATEMTNGPGVHQLIHYCSLPIPIGRSGRLKSNRATIAKVVWFVEVSSENSAWRRPQPGESPIKVCHFDVWRKAKFSRHTIEPARIWDVTRGKFKVSDFCH